MPLTDDFNAAVLRSKSLSERPSNEDLLTLYALYKQALEGDNAAARPGGFDFKAIAKHDAWAEKKGMSRDKAMEEYAGLVATLK